MKDINIVEIIKNKEKLEKHKGYIPIPILSWIDIGIWFDFLEKTDKKLYEKCLERNRSERQKMREDNHDPIKIVEKWVNENPQYSNFLIETPIVLSKEDQQFMEDYFKKIE